MFEADPRVLARLAELLRDQPSLVRNEAEGRIRDNFLQRFPAERLASLQGQALLDDLHGRLSRDCMAYWLEFKNDDDFRSKAFGSISGGSASKFGIWQSTDDDLWYVRESNRNRRLELSEAIGIAERQRDQLLAAGSHVRALPKDPSADAFRTLHEDLQRIAPDMWHRAFTHKYLFLQAPEALDDFHSAEYQVHFLIAMGIRPAGDGLYHAAAPFVSALRQFQGVVDRDVNMSGFTRLIGRMLPGVMHHWRVGTGERGEGWDAMREGAFAGIGWDLLADLETVVAGRKTRTAQKEAIRAALLEAYPDYKPQMLGRATAQVWSFFDLMQEGDRILAAKGMQILGVGRIRGGYRYEGHPFRHRREVEWLSRVPFQSPTKSGLQTTVSKLDKDHEIRLAAEKHLLDNPPAPPGSVDERDGKTAPASLPALDPVQAEIDEELRRKGQVILYGPPGTGKTYHALRTVRELAARGTHGRTWDSLSDTLRDGLVGDGPESDQRIWTCTFHPAYGYEDFIEGLRPTPVPGGLSFEPRMGLLRRICEQAVAEPRQPYFLVIDELNRGDIPRIFGEVITLLENDKRGTLHVTLPASEGRFTIPKNLFIVATMNTADRSIALLDTALRRRFGFFELMPDPALLASSAPMGVPLDRLLSVLNQRLLEVLGSDARNLQVGHAFLLRDGKPIREAGQLARVLRHEIVPLMQEYCYDSPDALARILGPDLFDEESQSIHTHLLEAGSAHALRDALAAWNDELLSSDESAAEESEEDVDGGEDAAGA